MARRVRRVSSSDDILNLSGCETCQVGPPVYTAPMRRPLACLVLACLAVSASAQPRGDTLAVVIRIDDIQSRSTITPRGLAPVDAVANARGAKITWLVIPGRLEETQNRDGVLESELRASALRGHEIAMHGYTHICPRCGQSDHELYCARDKVSHADTTQRRMLDREPRPPPRPPRRDAHDVGRPRPQRRRDHAPPARRAQRPRRLDVRRRRRAPSTPRSATCARPTTTRGASPRARTRRSARRRSATPGREGGSRATTSSCSTTRSRGPVTAVELRCAGWARCSTRCAPSSPSAS